MRIEIESLTLNNFKGQKNLQVKFGPVTNISGRNATGKTTIFDSFLWLLFGKDSEDRKDFGVKTLDSEGKVIPMIEHEVIGKIRIWDSDDADLPRVLILRRTLREKWVKSRGKAEAEFTGNETVYYVDMVPCTMKEYNDKVDSICKESLFKLLTNPAYFPNLNWTVQRQSLFNLIPTISNLEIIGTIPEKAMKQGKFDELMKVLDSSKTLEEYRKQIANDIRRINDEFVLIPARIDEVKRGMPEPEDWSSIESAIKNAEAFILRKEEEKTNKMASVEAETKKRADLQAQINTIKQTMATISYNLTMEYNEELRTRQSRKAEHERNVTDYNELIRKAASTLTNYRLDMEGLQRERAKLLEEWKKINADVFEYAGNDFCSVCKQELPEEAKASNREESLARFNKEKAFAIEQNTKKGKNVAGQIKQMEEQIANATAKIEKLKKDLDIVIQTGPMFEEVKPDEIEAKIQAAKDANEEYQRLLKEGKAIAVKLEKLGQIAPVDTSAIDKEISFARASLDQDRVRLAKNDIIIKAKIRQDELEKQQKKLAQEIAELEQMQFSIETFIRTKVSMLEERINSMFKVVRFKMFDLQINGQLAETCECSIGGVPYSDLNNAARINAGIDIINTMSKSYGIIAPIWIDNRESVNEIIPTRAQLINLYVTDNPQLIIN